MQQSLCKQASYTRTHTVEVLKHLKTTFERINMPLQDNKKKKKKKKKKNNNNNNKDEKKEYGWDSVSTSGKWNTAFLICIVKLVHVFRYQVR